MDPDLYCEIMSTRRRVLGESKGAANQMFVSLAYIF